MFDVAFDEEPRLAEGNALNEHVALAHTELFTYHAWARDSPGVVCAQDKDRVTVKFFEEASQVRNAQFEIVQAGS